MTSQGIYWDEALLREENAWATEADDNTEAPGTSELRFKENELMRTVTDVFEHGTIAYL